MAFSMDSSNPHTPQVRSLEMTGAPLDMDDAVALGFAREQEAPEMTLSAFSAGDRSQLLDEVLVDRKRLS